MSWNVISAFVLDQIFGYQTANKLRENLIALAARRPGRYLGGSKFIPNSPCWTPLGMLHGKEMSLGPNDVVDQKIVEIDGTFTGFTYRARVQCRTDRPVLAITPVIYNLSSGLAVGTGSACAVSRADYADASQDQTITLTIAAAINRYALRYTLNSISGQTWLTGEIEALATA
jgi:hypothetical protein